MEGRSSRKMVDTDLRSVYYTEKLLQVIYLCPSTWHVDFSNSLPTWSRLALTCGRRSRLQRLRTGSRPGQINKTE